MRILNMKQPHDFLSDIFGTVSPITRCREGHNPFTQQLENLVAFDNPVQTISILSGDTGDLIS